MLTHVGYEVWMCAWAASQIRSEVRYPPEMVNPRMNAMLEVQLIHARSLIELLLRPIDARPGDDDLLRTDFDPPMCTPWTPGPSDAMGRLTGGHWRDLQSYVAHLSWQRRVRPRSWKYVSIGMDIVAVAESWARHLHGVDPSLSAELEPYLTQARRLLGAPSNARGVTSTGSWGPTGPVNAHPAHATGAVGATGPMNPGRLTSHRRAIRRDDDSDDEI